MNDAIFQGMLTRLGLGVTKGRMDFLREWAKYEDVPEAIRNPLATTLSGSVVPRSPDNPYGHGPGKYNNANPPNGVAIYATDDHAADALTITLTGDRRYEPIINALTIEKIASPSALVSALTTWGTTATPGSEFARNILNGWQPDAWKAQPLPVPGLTPERINAALQARYFLVRLAHNKDAGLVEDAVAILRANPKFKDI